MASKVDSSNLSVIPEEKSSARKHHDDEVESVYNHKSKSAYGGGHKKKLHPLMLGPSRQNPGKIISLHSASKNNLSEFTQRIMSAKLLRVKQVQNQLTETQIQLNELINENRILRNLQKRQEGALRRYEGNHAELPQLIRAHNEEIRTLKANNKAIKAQLRESNTKLKERETELEALRDSYNKLKKLSTEKNLLEREKLHKKVEELQDVIKEQEEKIQVLSRKVLLESKNYRHHLNIEVMKHKETQKDLHSALSMINKLESQLLSKEKALPGGKTLLKRDNKNLMPVIANKSIDIQPKLGISEDSFLSRDDGKRKSQISESPDSELELLNGLGSSEDTPSPTQDIFPDINASKKFIREMETSSRLDILQLNNDHPSRSQKFKKTPLPKRNSRISIDPEMSARVIAEKINEDMETIEDLALKVDATSSASENRHRMSSLYKEVHTSASKLEDEVNKQKLKNGSEDIDENKIETKQTNPRRNVPKRKLEEEKLSKPSFETYDLEGDSDLTEAQQQKLESMSKTWNDIKSKIQEERQKAEEKMKELSKMNPNEGIKKSVSSDSEVDDENEPEEPTVEDVFALEPKKELRFVNFTDDAYILQELEKTDKIFNKLKNETRKPVQKTPPPVTVDKKPPKRNATPKPKPQQQQQQQQQPQHQQQQQDVKSFRTESQREPKYLKEFQTEYQKQNLLKALKAIDVGKDPNVSSDESDDSKTDAKGDKFYQRNGLKHIQRLSSGKSDNDLMTELFGTGHRLDKTLECGTVAGTNN